MMYIRRSLASFICSNSPDHSMLVALAGGCTPVLGIIRPCDGLGDGRGQVAIADAELDRDEPAVVLAVDVRAPGLCATMWVNCESGMR